MSGICDTCQRLKRMGCGIAMDGLKSCDWYEHESNYDRLFGTPERAALTLFAMCHGMRDCGFCPIGRAEGGNCTSCDGAETVIEWMRGDTE